MSHSKLTLLQKIPIKIKNLPRETSVLQSVVEASPFKVYFFTSEAKGKFLVKQKPQVSVKHGLDE